MVLRIMKDLSWIKKPNLWALAADKAAKEEPRWTRAFYRLALAIYQKLGGTLQETEEEVPE